MDKTIRIAVFLVLATSIVVQYATPIDQRQKFFGNNWPIPFKPNAQTLPSVAIKLDPAEDPLPQVNAEIQILEQGRKRLERGLMAKLEDEFNKQLDISQKKIEDTVNRAMAVFQSVNILYTVIRGALLPIINPRKAARATKGFYTPQRLYTGVGGNLSMLPQIRNSPAKGILAFRQRRSNATDSSKSVFKPLDGPIPYKNHNPSFLELDEQEKLNQKLDVLPTALSPPPSVKIEVTDFYEPDSKIKQKMDEAEQLRADEEVKMFETAVEEFGQLTKLTIQELEKHIQIQMNPYLVDVESIRRAVQEELPKPGLFRRTFSFIEIQDTEKNIKRKEGYSFAGLDHELKSGLFGMEKNLNVKIIQSDKPYPTVDQLVSDMERKRDAAEELGRKKILQLQLKLLKAQFEMIREALKVHMARIIAQYSPAIEAIKTEIAAEKLR